MRKVKWLDRTALLLPSIALVTSSKQLHAAEKELGITTKGAFLLPGSLAEVHEYSSDNEGQLCIVCIRLDKSRSQEKTASILAHEAVHVKQKMLQWIGEDRPGNEIEAYIVQNIVEILLDEYNRQLKQKR